MRDHVGETIDGADYDLGAGPDAMRWTPEPPPEDTPSRRHEPAVAFNNVIWAQHVGYSATVAAWPEAVRLDRALIGWDAAANAEGTPPEPPPDDPRERALQAARQRGGGPDRTPAGKARRPRRHQS